MFSPYCLLPHNTNSVGQGDSVERMGQWAPYLGAVSSGTQWVDYLKSLFQSHTTQSLLESPTLASPGGVHHWLRLGETSFPNYTHNFSMAGPLYLGKQIKIVLHQWWHLLSPAGEKLALCLPLATQLCSGPEPLMQMCSEGLSCERCFLPPTQLSSTGQVKVTWENKTFIPLKFRCR